MNNEVLIKANGKTDFFVDGENWKMIRYFRLDCDKQVKVGICAQSPIGDFCKVKFEYPQIIPNTYNNIRI